VTSYNTRDNYTEDSITGEVIKIISDGEFVLKSNGYLYWCVIQGKDIAPPVVGEERTYHGLVELYFPHDKKYPIKMLVRDYRRMM
jgi:hypothetical protein